MQENKPEDSMGTLSGLHYKIGRFGYAYYWGTSEWVKSDKEPSQVKRQIENKSHPFAVC